MPDPVHVACPACLAKNRVPAERLSANPTCGRCKHALFDAHPLAVTEASFDAVVSRTDLPVVVDFWAPWCGPCISFAPVYEQAAARIEPRARLAKLDTEAHPAIAARYAIRSIPTLAVLRGGRELARMSGALPLREFLAWLEPHLRG